MSLFKIYKASKQVNLKSNKATSILERPSQHSRQVSKQEIILIFISAFQMFGSVWKEPIWSKGNVDITTEKAWYIDTATADVTTAATCYMILYIPCDECEYI